MQMKEILRNKKRFIINSFIENPTLDLHKFSYINNIDYSHISRVIKEYKKLISTTYPIYCVKSLDLTGVYYLFSDGEEKTIDTLNKKYDNLTDYEKYWLKLNKRIDAE
jgi:hypothetical protein